MAHLDNYFKTNKKVFIIISSFGIISAIFAFIKTNNMVGDEGLKYFTLLLLPTYLLLFLLNVHKFYKEKGKNLKIATLEFIFFTSILMMPIKTYYHLPPYTNLIVAAYVLLFIFFRYRLEKYA